MRECGKCQGRGNEGQWGMCRCMSMVKGQARVRLLTLLPPHRASRLSRPVRVQPCPHWDRDGLREAQGCTCQECLRLRGAPPSPHSQLCHRERLDARVLPKDSAACQRALPTCGLPASITLALRTLQTPIKRVPREALAPPECCLVVGQGHCSSGAGVEPGSVLFALSVPRGQPRNWYGHCHRPGRTLNLKTCC